MDFRVCSFARWQFVLQQHERQTTNVRHMELIHEIIYYAGGKTRNEIVTEGVGLKTRDFNK